MIYSEIVRPRYADLGQEGMLSCAAVLEILETAGGHHADQAGDPLVRDTKTDPVWVLTEWRAEFLHSAKSRDSLQVSTWLSADSPAGMTLRGYELLDADGNKLARAEARCVLVNINTGRLVRVDRARFDAYLPENRPAFDRPYERLFAPESYDSELTVQIRKSDMDFNGHVHNTRYLSLAAEICPELLMAGERISAFRVLYKKSVTECMPLSVRRKDDEEGLFICISGAESGELYTLIRAKRR